ncbi:MAG: hypothetical protein ACREID_10300, partial [Planctomycetota bacterium]
MTDSAERKPRQEIAAVEAAQPATPATPACKSPELRLVPKLIDLVLEGTRILHLYPKGHRRLERHLTLIAQLFGDLFGDETTALELSVRGMTIHACGEELPSIPDETAVFAAKLRRRRLRSVRLLPGATIEEARLLVELLGLTQKRLAVEGGAAALLYLRSHAHLSVTFLGGPVEPGGEGSDADADPDLPPATAHLLESTLSSAETLDRIEEIRRVVLAADAPTEDDALREGDRFDALAWEFLARREWASVGDGCVPATVRAFLELLARAVGHAVQARPDAVIEEVRSLLASNTPLNLLPASPSAAPEEPFERAFSREPAGAAGALDDARGWLRRAPAEFRSALDAHAPEENAL